MRQHLNGSLCILGDLSGRWGCHQNHKLSFELGGLLQHRTTSSYGWPFYTLKLFMQFKPKLPLVLTETTFSKKALFTKMSLDNLVQKFSTSINPIFKGLNDFLNHLLESIIRWIIYFVDCSINHSFLVLVTLRKVAHH